MTKISAMEMVRRANEIVEIKSAEEALAAQNDANAVLIDIRDIRELGREGKIADAMHVPRGMVEFWFDEESPYHKPALAEEDRTYVLFCAAGWRSALAAKSLVDMGFTNIAHIDGGFAALKDAGATIETAEKK